MPPEKWLIAAISLVMLAAIFPIKAVLASKKLAPEDQKTKANLFIKAALLELPFILGAVYCILKFVGE